MLDAAVVDGKEVAARQREQRVDAEALQSGDEQLSSGALHCASLARPGADTRTEERDQASGIGRTPGGGARPSRAVPQARNRSQPRSTRKNDASPMPDSW